MGLQTVHLLSEADKESRACLHSPFFLFSRREEKPRISLRGNKQRLNPIYEFQIKFDSSPLSHWPQRVT